MKRALAILVLMSVAGAAQGKPGKPAPSVFPMAKGTSWTYRAHVKWAKGESDLRWTMTVTDSVETAEVSAALLRGGPWDLAWYQPNVHPHTHVVIRVGDTYYLQHDDGRDTFADIKSGNVRDLSDRLADDVWFRMPLRQGETFCPPESSGQPPMYCWSVDTVGQAQAVKIGKVSLPAAQTYQLVFRSNPDHEVVTLVPGIGITAWEYAHHGTLAETKLQLIQFHPGD